jgi:hypothetical protein
MANLSADEPIRDLADRMMRASLQHAENLHAFLEQAVPDLAAGFDCTRARLLNREFPLEDWGRREAEPERAKLFEVVKAAQGDLGGSPEPHSFTASEGFA